MKKWILVFLALLPILAGCGKEAEELSPTYTIPTLPSFDEAQSPLVKLNDAVDVLKNAQSYQITFDTGEGSQTQTVIPPMDAESLAQVKALVPNENFLADLCSEQITVSPSNTGSFTFMRNGLTGDEFSAITGINTQANSCSVSLTIAPEGYLSRLELQMDDTVTFLQIDQVK